METYFKRFKKAYVALSGGADSAAVLMLAAEYMGTENVTAFTCVGGHVFQYEIEKAAEIAAKVGVPHVTAPAEMPAIFFDNPADRCYHCKRAVLAKIAEFAKEIPIFDGTNIDDDPQNRPGFKALAETGTISPLRDLALGKSFTLEKVKELGIDFHDESCKATRLVKPITQERMDRVERVENILRDSYRGIRFKIDENRVEFKKALKLNAADFENITGAVRLSL